MRVKHINVKIADVEYVITFETNGSVFHAYIKGYTTFLNYNDELASSDSETEQVYSSFINDIRLGRVEIVSYKLLGYTYHEARVAESATWDELPKAEYITDIIVKKFGKCFRTETVILLDKN